MDLRNVNKIMITIVLTVLIVATSSVFYSSNAASVGFLRFNNAPRKYLTVSKEKLEDITIRMEDNNQISSVQLYTVNAKGEKKKIDFSSANTEDSKKHVYTLSHSKLLKGKEKQFYVEVKDGTGNIQKSYFKVCVKSKKVNGKTVKYYALNDSPRVIHPVASGNTMSLGIKDNAGTKYVKIQDANDGNKEIHKFTELGAGEQKIDIDLTKFKVNDKIYKLRIITEDHSSQKAVRTIYFEVDPNAKEQKSTTEKKEKTEGDTKNKNVTSFVAALEKISQRVQSDYKAKRYWKYTNGIHSENKLPNRKTFEKALKDNVRNTNCADYVMWALHDCGIFTANQKFYGNYSGGITYRRNSKTKTKSTLKKYATLTRIGGKKRPKTLMSEGKLKKGDILTYKGHTNVYAGNGKWYDAGRRMGQNGKGTRANYTFTTFGPLKITYNQPVYYVIRLKDRS